MFKHIHQLKPLTYRHFLIFWRTKQVLLRILFQLVLSLVLAIVIGFVLADNENLDPTPSTFNDFQTKNSLFYAFVCKDNIFQTDFVQKLSKEFHDLILKDTNKEAELVRFNTSTEFDTWVYDIQNSGQRKNLILGIEIGDTFQENEHLPITVLYNNSIVGVNTPLVNYFSQLYRALWHVFGLGELTTRFITLNKQALDLIVSSLVPFFMIIGLTGFLSVISTITTDDCKSAKRQYLITINVKLPMYWIACLIVDYIVWIICCLICWIVFFACGFILIRNNVGFTLWGIVFNGFSYLLFTYCVSFLFNNPDISGSLSVMISMFLLLIGFIADILRGNSGDDVVNWVYALFPPLNFYSIFATSGRLYNAIDPNVSIPFSDLWKRKDTLPLLIFSLVNIVIWSLVLSLVEFMRRKIPEWKTKKDFKNNPDFLTLRRQNPTEEAIKAAEDAEAAYNSGSNSEFSVLVYHVSRLFFDNEKKIVPAVCDVSFGIKKGSMYGFLGSNGAGKTTLMKIITGEIPCSSGEVLINSLNQEYGISICPQFNDHLTNEMTAIEHFKIFSELFKLDNSISSFLNEIIDQLELEEHKNKIIKELSGGNARKVAVALSLLNPSEIVLFDEPTSSLDPMARHAVHDLLNRFRGQKTFMICTHLLDEAESLCDTISIMFHGSVYVVGTPQYLSSKFGTEWKVDILLDNDSEEVGTRVTNFMAEKLPSARISINRPSNRIYSIPADDIEIAPLFQLLKQGVEDHVGIKYFTCSSSTLEKVFLELIIRSEEDFNEDDQEVLI